MSRTAITISGDSWDGKRVHGWTIENASMRDFQRVFDALDADVHTILEIRYGPGVVPQLVIGGGAGRYVVYAMLEHEQDFWTLVRENAPEERILLRAGGQEGRYHAWKIVDEARAMSAARVFLESGGLDTQQKWHHR